MKSSRKLSYESQLETAKFTIQSHYTTRIIDNTSSESSMFCMIGGTPNANMTCDYCGKNTQTKKGNGKPFCFKLIKDLKGK